MVYQSKKAFVLLIPNVVIFFYLYLDNLNKLHSNQQDFLSLWGVFFFKLLVVLVITNIIVLIIFNLFNNMFSKNKAPTISDERDRLIELRAVRNLCFIFAFGFFLAMAAIAIHQPISTMFTILAFTILVSVFVSYASYIFYYERGY
ncbi:hypothetical protein IGL98_002705 [Enterococcus sp. DIV0840]|uniref:hypothetical protein n=1 Tax=Enterococcus TaxID=1350 RepID=UPI001A8D4AC8|nr:MULTISPECIES: hypothetical protein [Enterococcus]MBO0434693.1 hypothetical protein [Enterococcus sp. DIV0849a]MBO0473082.1 hypothetical protein [Enterococcus ureasiticus]